MSILKARCRDFNDAGSFILASRVSEAAGGRWPRRCRPLKEQLLLCQRPALCPHPHKGAVSPRAAMSQHVSCQRPRARGPQSLGDPHPRPAWLGERRAEPNAVIWCQSQRGPGEGAWGAMEQPLAGGRLALAGPGSGASGSCPRVLGMDGATLSQAQQQGTRAPVPSAPSQSLPGVGVGGGARLCLGAAGRCAFLPALLQGDGVRGGDLRPCFTHQSPRQRVAACSLALLRY